MDDRALIHRLALSMLKGIGPVNARNLVAYCGGVDALFTDPKARKALEKVPGIGPERARAIQDAKVLGAAEKELAFVHKHKLRMLFYLDEDYPKRLKNCDDAPVLLFVRGTAQLDHERTVAIVGTRSPTEHGKRLCVDLVEGLKESDVLIVSGLAYGIDIVAHRTALKAGLRTVGCVAHGLDRIYPGEHATTAKEMTERGGLVSELPSGSKFVPGNFPARNRVIAGLSDCTIVIESGGKGGSLITADIANSYDREVMAFPGRATDPKSEGCNRLIKDSKAHLITGAGDVLKLMEWLPSTRKKVGVQQSMFTELQPEEQVIVNVLKEKGRLDIDSLCFAVGMLPHKASTVLLTMEFNGVVRSLPGKVYELT